MRKRYFGIIPGLLALTVYLSTTCRSIWIGDSGEFALALKTLGICHPPGYPLFTILGRFFIMLMPFLRVTFAANIFNVLIAAAGVSAVYYLFKKYLSVPAAFIISLLWAFSPLFWGETAGIEVYPLNILLIVLTLLAVESRHNRRWVLAAYLFGLALTNHPTALTILPVLVYLFVKDRAYQNRKLYPEMAVAIILAGSLYFYLPIRSALQPLADWGNPSSIKAMINHMTLEQYRGWISSSLDNLALSLKLAYYSLLRSWHWPGIIVGMAGLIIGFMKYRTRTVMAVLMLAMLLLLSSSHQALNYQPFYLPAMLAVLLLFGNFIGWLEFKTKARVALWSIYALGLAICLLILLSNYRDLNKSNYTLSEDYSKSILNTAGDGILLTAGDINSFTTLYLRYVENYEPGVEVFDRSIRLPALIKLVHTLSGINYDKYYPARAALLNNSPRKIFLAKNGYAYDPDWLKIGVPYYSYGVLYAVKFMPPDTPEVLTYPYDYKAGDVLSRQLLINLDLAKGETYLKEQSYDTLAANASYNLAFSRLKDEPRAIVVSNVGIYFRQAGYLDLALRTYELALAKPIITAATRHDILFNISNVYKSKGNKFLGESDYQNAVDNFLEALKYDPENERLFFNIGLIYAKGLNDTLNACTYFQKYLQKAPSDTKVRALVDSLGCNESRNSRN